ncbi:hypothetical protein PHYPSEUDO_001867 [Phytophthora pseudosyringae]|uniref:RING-type domain-containing protein n=1 Tax=Phytophthora pseudosyringae TaxID=221518 RepID=A0A8T1WIG2_9STRA|nr:hypothetical protein PHYPSEUDO_001867 [Phytophthora pseudosyringae]
MATLFKAGDTATFFGLSGAGKPSLSVDDVPLRGGLHGRVAAAPGITEPQATLRGHNTHVCLINTGLTGGVWPAHEAAVRAQVRGRGAGRKHSTPPPPAPSTSARTTAATPAASPSAAGQADPPPSRANSSHGAARLPSTATDSQAAPSASRAPSSHAPGSQLDCHCANTQYGTDLVHADLPSYPGHGALGDRLWSLTFQFELRCPLTAMDRAPATTPDGDTSTRCEACKSCGAILELDGCGHRFHPRCIFAWPATHCEVCAEPVGNVLVFRESKNRPNSSARKGKWSIDEHKYANLLMKQFQLGALPLADGLHLRVFMASMLQCDPLRVTKKYAGQAIGKQNFSFQRDKSYCYNLHVKLQKQLSNLRNHYYWHVQYRCKFGPNLNIQELKAAEADYWIREFCKFAKKIGQKVEFTTAEAAGAVVPTSDRNTSATAAIGPRPATESKETEDAVPPKSVVLPPVSSLIARVPVVKVEGTPDVRKLMAKGEQGSAASSMKDGVSLMLGFSAPIDQPPSPLSADELNDPSAFVDLALTDLSQDEVPSTSNVDASLQPCAQEILKKGNWMNDWMKEAELEWSKGAISWSLSLSAEPLADFA